MSGIERDGGVCWFEMVQGYYVQAVEIHGRGERCRDWVRKKVQTEEKRCLVCIVGGVRNDGGGRWRRRERRGGDQ
jgi:hypothetical protein